MCEYLERITIMDKQPDIIDSEVQELQKGIAELQATLDSQRL
jgi:archaellum component FlaC